MPGDYSGDELIKWGVMERTCVQADGLSAPKVLRTKGSDGKLYKLIWKVCVDIVEELVKKFRSL